MLSRYRNNFVTGIPSGRVNTGYLEIRLQDSIKFVQRRPYRLAPVERDIVQGRVSELLEANIIHFSCSPLASPITPVKKRDESDVVVAIFTN